MKMQTSSKNYANHHLTNWVSLACQELGSETRISNNRHSPKERTVCWHPSYEKTFWKGLDCNLSKMFGFPSQTHSSGCFTAVWGLHLQIRLEYLLKSFLYSLSTVPHIGSMASLITPGTRQKGGRPLDLRRKEASGTDSGKLNDF